MAVLVHGKKSWCEKLCVDLLLGSVSAWQGGIMEVHTVGAMAHVLGLVLAGSLCLSYSTRAPLLMSCCVLRVPSASLDKTTDRVMNRAISLRASPPPSLWS